MRLAKTLAAGIAAIALVSACTQKEAGMDPTAARIDPKDERYTFALADGVTRTKVTFRNHFGIELAGDLYAPQADGGKPSAALAICGPFGAVKEQSSGFYA
ncbi:MAG: alpha/beta hydrolase, partial [Treponemataceae bacterium]|nr:alpha/beta hydrolase [Treponemataceae bacterium]